MRTTRTFVAIPVPDSLGSKLTRLQTLLAPDLPGVRWSVVSPFHLTLAFLGDVADTELNKVCRTVEEVAADFPPFDLRLEGLGVFPNPSPGAGHLGRGSVRAWTFRSSTKCERHSRPRWQRRATAPTTASSPRHPRASETKPRRTPRSDPTAQPFPNLGRRPDPRRRTRRHSPRRSPTRAPSMAASPGLS